MIQIIFTFHVMKTVMKVTHAGESYLKNNHYGQVTCKKYLNGVN